MMKMKKRNNILFFVLTICFLTACQQKGDLNGNKLRFGLSQCYLVESTESYVPQIDSIGALYLPYSSFGPIQYPVNRVIKGEGYTTFIALSTVDDLKINYEGVEKFHEGDIISKRVGDENIHLLLKQEEYYNYQYLFTVEEHVYTINYISNDRTKIKSFFDDKSFVEKKLQCTFE